MIFRSGVLSACLFSIFSLSGPVVAQGHGGCPAFSSAMVDAAFMAINYSPSPHFTPAVYAVDDPEVPQIYCSLTDPNEFPPKRFQVAVGEGVEPGDEGVAHVFGRSEDPAVGTLLRTRLADLTPAELHACRAQVRASFVWSRYCKQNVIDLD